MATYKAGTQSVNASLARYRNGFVHCMTIVPKHCLLRADAYWRCNALGCSMQLEPGSPSLRTFSPRGALNRKNLWGSAPEDLRGRSLSTNTGRVMRLVACRCVLAQPNLDYSTQHAGGSREALQIGFAPEGFGGPSLNTNREYVMRPVTCRCILALSCGRLQHTRGGRQSKDRGMLPERLAVPIGTVQVGVAAVSFSRSQNIQTAASPHSIALGGSRVG